MLETVSIKTLRVEVAIKSTVLCTKFMYDVKMQDIDVDDVSSKDVYMLVVYMYILIICSCLWTTQILPL